MPLRSSKAAGRCGFSTDLWNCFQRTRFRHHVPLWQYLPRQTLRQQRRRVCRQPGAAFALGRAASACRKCNAFCCHLQIGRQCGVTLRRGVRAHWRSRATDGVEREGGATREKQLTDLPKVGTQADMLKTLDSVYNKRGSAPEVRAAIESECVAEKQKQADAATMLRSLTEQAGGAAAAAPAASAGSAAGGNRTAKAPQ